jgi:ABC-type polysaccharide/polyol phosphate export permease
MMRPDSGSLPAPAYDSASLPPPFIDEARSLLRYSGLVRQWISRTITTRYKRSWLGAAWTLVNPLLTMTILTIVFSQLFGLEPRAYALYVLSGLITWNFMAQSTTAAMSDLYWSGGLLTRVYLPKSAFAVSAVGAGVVNLLIALVPLTLLAVLFGAEVGWTWLLIPLAILPLMAFTLGVGLLVSTASIYFPDVLPMYEILLTAWFYLTPIIYRLEALPAGLQSLLRLNPMVAFIGLFRLVLMGDLSGLLPQTALAYALGLVVLGVGWAVFTRRSRSYPYRV